MLRATVQIAKALLRFVHTVCDPRLLRCYFRHQKQWQLASRVDGWSWWCPKCNKHRFWR